MVRLPWIPVVLFASVLSLAAVESCGSSTGGSPGSGGSAGSPSSSSSGASSSGTGGSTMTCKTAADCPATPSACLKVACTMGACATTPVAQGPIATDPMPGDCQRPMCDGMGHETMVASDTDVPMPSNPCLVGSCTNGVPSTGPRPIDTSCSAGVCDGNGACVECNAPSDCTGTSTDCATITCSSHVCGKAFAAQGTKTSMQTAGTCHTNECDGMGNVVSAIDNTNVPVDNNPCTTDLCTAGTPSNPPVDPGTACGTSLVCDSTGHCVGCTQPTDCSGTDDFCKTRTCNVGVCGFDFTTANTPLPAAQQVSGNCTTFVCDGSGNTTGTPNPNNLPPATSQCTTPTCTGTVPSNPPVSPGTPCTQGGSVCNATGQCVACNGPSDCPPTSTLCETATCTSNACGTTPASTSTVCAPASCSNGTATAVSTCDGAGNCGAGATTTCPPYACSGATCLTTCTQDGDCTSPNTCDTGIGRCTTGPKCTDYCNELAVNCTGTNAMYPATANCIAVCATLPQGSLSDVGGEDTVGCRLYHGGAPSVADPFDHCPHAGPAGEGICGDDCTSFCIIAQAVCTGANQQFLDTPTCMSACAQFPTTPQYNATITSGNSFACRMYHVTAASLLPTIHCPHIVLNSPVCT